MVWLLLLLVFQLFTIQLLYENISGGDWLLFLRVYDQAQKWFLWPTSLCWPPEAVLWYHQGASCDLHQPMRVLLSSRWASQTQISIATVSDSDIGWGQGAGDGTDARGSSHTFHQCKGACVLILGLELLQFLLLSKPRSLHFPSIL